MEKVQTISNKLSIETIGDVQCWVKPDVDEKFVYYMLKCCKKLLEVSVESLGQTLSDASGKSVKKANCPYCKAVIEQHVLCDLIQLYTHLKDGIKVCMYCLKDIREWGITLNCRHSLCQKCLKEKIIKSNDDPIKARGFCRMCYKFCNTGK